MLNKLCDYGCGQEAKYQLKNGKLCCSESHRNCIAIRKKISESSKNWYRNHPEGKNGALKGRTGWNHGLSKETDSRIAKQAEGIKRAWARGAYDNVDFNLKYSKHSQKSQQLFWQIYYKLPDDIKEDVHFAELNEEYKIGCFQVDFCIPSQKKIIEYFGSYWHMNPKIYKPEDFNKKKKMTAKEIWKLDKTRIEFFENRGYHVEIIWGDK